MWSSRAVVPAVALLVLLALSSALWAEERGLGARPPTPEEAAYVSARVTEMHSVSPNALAQERVSAEAQRRGRSRDWVSARNGLPTEADNSTLQYFPPIRSQGSQGSCTAWSSAYYYDTYTQAMDEGYNVSGGNNNHICSPAFIYPLVNDGVDSGAFIGLVMTRLNDVGASSWTLKPYSSSDYTSWPSEAAWVNAMQNRTQASYSINASNAEGLQALKQHLANGNLAVTSFSVYATFYDHYPEDQTGINNGVYYCADGSSKGGHAVTLIGYDDGRSYLDHRDGQTHYGAFLLANSWGNGWGVVNSTGSGSKGFFWVAYDMFLRSTFGPGAYYNSDRDHYRPRLYASVGINHSQRGQVRLRAGLTATPVWTSYYAVDLDGGNDLAVSGANRIAVDMTDGCYLIGANPTQAFAQLRVDTHATTPGTITSAGFYEDMDGDGTYFPTSSADPTVTVNPGAIGYAYATLYPHAITVVAAADPEAVNSGGATSLTASFSDSRGDGVASWAWSDGGAGGAFSPSATAQNPTYTAAANTGIEAVVVDLTVTATCDGDPAEVASDTVPITVRAAGIYADVPSDYWAYTFIRACGLAGIAGGYQDGTYRPTSPVDRASMAVYVARGLAGGDALVPTAPAEATFTDVGIDHWAFKYVEYAYANHIVGGYGDGYHPSDPVDRGQMAVFIARCMVTPHGDEGLAGYTPPPTPTFPDVPTGYWSYKYIEYIASQAVTGGYEDGYHPGETVNRAQMAVYVQRAFGLPM